MKKSATNQEQGLSKIIIVIGVVLILLALAFVYFFYYRQPTNTNNDNANTNQAVANRNLNINQNTNTAVINVNTNANTNAVPVDPDAKLKTELRNLAINFTEVFGSYSNQSDFGNIASLKIFMTDDMKEWADDYLISARANQPPAEVYYGISTKAISATLQELDEKAGQAEFVVTCQRKESTGSVANSRIFYQDNLIKFAKIKEVWKIDGSFWQ